MGNYITINIELYAIKNFLSKTLKSVDAETIIICKQEEDGEFRDADDFENALFAPMEQEAIAIRAVLYEINALIESELCYLAIEAYHNSTQHSTNPKCLGTVCDLPMGKVRQLIEQHHNINLSNLPDSTEVKQIRQTVNAFKHRKGFKDSRRGDPKSNVGEKYQPTRDNAYQAIDTARVFLWALYGKLKTHPKTPGQNKTTQAHPKPNQRSRTAPKETKAPPRSPPAQS